MSATLEPIRLLTTCTVARRIGISREMLGQHVRRKVVTADYISSDGRALFLPSKLPDIQQAIEQNRRRHWKHAHPATL